MGLSTDQRLSALEEKVSALELAEKDLKKSVQELTQKNDDLQFSLENGLAQFQERMNSDISKINQSFAVQAQNNQSYVDKFLEVDRVLSSVQDGYARSVQLLRGGLGFNVQLAKVPNYMVLAFDGTAFIEVGSDVDSIALPAAKGVKNGRMVIVRGNSIKAVSLVSQGEGDIFIRKLQAVGRSGVNVAKNDVLIFVALGSRGVWYEV